MDAAKALLKQEDMKFFNLLSSILVKNKCKLTFIDLISGEIEVEGDTEDREICCYDDLNNYLYSFIVNQEERH